MSKILMDINVCKLGYSGIPQDTRRIFNMLKNKVDIFFDSSTGYNTNIKDNSKIILHEAFNIENFFKTKNTLFTKRKLVSIDFNRHKEFIWQSFFAKGMKIEEFEKINKIKVFSRKVSFLNSINKFNTIDTRSWDSVIFPMPTNINISKNTRKIIRHHDSIPIMYPHLVLGIKKAIYNHYQALKHSVNTDNSIFVCNSEPTREELLSIYPHMENRSVVIPCSIDDEFTKIETNREALSIIINKNLSWISLKDKKLRLKDQIRIRNRALNSILDNDFILTISNIDPKKNYNLLLNAWEKVIETKKNLKLVIVSSPGWDYEKILNRIQTYVIDGKIIHLENVGNYNLRLLLSHAKAFVFPSIIEGFGLGILEAARCKCPVIASDIPAHNYVLKDYFIKVNPYSVKELALAIKDVVESSINNSLIEDAYLRTDYFTSKNLKKEWEKVLNV